MQPECFPSYRDANRSIRHSLRLDLETVTDVTPPLHVQSGARVSSTFQTATILVIIFVAFLSLPHYNVFGLHFWPSIPFAIRSYSYLAVVDHGAVATENERCSDIGVNILKDGGNAVDAAIGAALCIGVVNMFSAGIGGGGFVTVRIPPKEPGGTSEVFTVNFREAAPGGAYETMYADDPSAAIYGGLSVGVPGELRGFEEAHRRWGNLEWSRLVFPSVKLALGWTVDTELAKMIERYADLMLSDPDWGAIFAPNGRPLLEGQTIRRTNFSRTLEAIAKEGASAFYKGPIADSIIRKAGEAGGIITHEDLERYTVEVERAIQGTYHGKKVYTSDVPASGSVLLHMLNLLERYDLVGEGRTPLNVHRIVEATKFGFAAQSRIGDLPCYTGNKTRVYEIPSKGFADGVAVNLSDDRTYPPEHYNPEFDIKTDHGTSHISVADKNGMAVALTSTLNWYFGAQILDPETGIILNDQMDGFSVPGTVNGLGLWPSSFNYPEPGKRPVSSISPTVVEHSDGSLYLVIGASGGPDIPTAIVQTMLNLDWGMNACDAVEHGRIRGQLFSNQVSADNILPAQEIYGLWDRGHNVKVFETNGDVAVQTIVSKNGMLHAVSDSRKYGIAAGY